MKGLQSVKNMSEKELEYSSNLKFMKVKWATDSKDRRYSLFGNDIPDDIIQNAMKEVSETEEKRVEGMKSLKKFMQKKKLTCSDDDVLLSVLRICKYNIKKSESKLEKFLKIRQSVGRKLAAIDIKDLEVFMNEMGSGLFPYRDSHGRIVFYTLPIENVSKYETDFVLTYLIACIIFFLSIPKTSLLGLVYIAECDSSSMQTWYSLLKVFRRLTLNLVDIPISIKRIEIVNGNFLFRWFYTGLRPFIPGKLANRISFLGFGYENLHKHYHPDILPNKFGGNLGSLNDTHYRKGFLNFVEKLKTEYD